MNNSHIKRLSVLAVIASSLLAVGIVTALSMIEQADALTVTQKATITQRANGANGGNGGSGGSGTAGTAGTPGTAGGTNTATVTQSSP